MIARYDLANNSASFDFFTWLVLAEAKGAKEIVFGVDNVKRKVWSEEVVFRRFGSILDPGPALIGLPKRIGRDGVEPHGPNLRNLVDHGRNGRTFKRLRSVLPPGKAEYTVTLRRNSHNPHRNSNEDAWRGFAREIDAYVIEDYDVEPIDLHERMALYAGARMNLGVVTGPLHLCLLADYPVMMFSCNKEADAYAVSGIPSGTSYPWANRDQINVWESDSPKVIQKSFEKWVNR